TAMDPHHEMLRLRMNDWTTLVTALDATGLPVTEVDFPGTFSPSALGKLAKLPQASAIEALRIDSGDWEFDRGGPSLEKGSRQLAAFIKVASALRVLIIREAQLR